MKKYEYEKRMNGDYWIRIIENSPDIWAPGKIYIRDGSAIRLNDCICRNAGNEPAIQDFIDTLLMGG